MLPNAIIILREFIEMMTLFFRFQIVFVLTKSAVGVVFVHVSVILFTNQTSKRSKHTHNFQSLLSVFLLHSQMAPQLNDFSNAITIITESTLSYLHNCLCIQNSHKFSKKNWFVFICS